jgi:hypothetical protein
MHHLSTHGFARTALGITVTGWWASHYQTEVLKTDDPAFVEAMAMKWLMSDHKKSKFAGVVMDGSITVAGKTHDALILRSQAVDQSVRMMVHSPYYTNSTKQEPWQIPIVDFPADQTVPPEARQAALEVMLKSMFGKN